MQVVLYESLLETNESSASLSYHLTGNIDLAGFPPVPLDFWASAGDATPAPMMVALLAGERFTRLYSNGARQGVVRQIDLHVQAIPRHVQVTLVKARLVSEQHRPRRRHSRSRGNRSAPGSSPSAMSASQSSCRLALPRAICASSSPMPPRSTAPLLQPRVPAPPVDLETVLAEARNQHPADRIYVSLLAPEAQGEINGQTLTSLPLSVANALEPLRNTQEAGLNGESAEVAGEAPAGGVLTGFQILNLHIEPGGGLN